jgi:hypothetical protein
MVAAQLNELGVGVGGGGRHAPVPAARGHAAPPPNKPITNILDSGNTQIYPLNGDPIQGEHEKRNQKPRVDS